MNDDLPYVDHPDIDAVCIPCGARKWEAAGERCRNAVWHHPDTRLLELAVRRAPGLIRQAQQRAAKLRRQHCTGAPQSPL